MNYEIVILGSDANAYYMARCAHEYTGLKPHLLAINPLSFTKYTNILTISYHDELWTEEGFLKIVNQYAEKSAYDKILLISTNETYTEFIAKLNDKLNQKLFYNKISFDLLHTLTNKELFYKTYKKSVLKFPETFYFDCKKSKLLPSTISYPMVLKPANVVMYNHLKFEGKHKIYRIENENELKNTIDLIKNNGYTDRLIIQEYIPGGDDCLFDSVVYVSKKHEVKLISFAQIGLQERTKTMVGNAAVLINGFQTKTGNVEKMVKEIKAFMESIDYSGFAEIDMKYDSRDNTFKVLEINARQGRCSYYITPLGANLVETMVNDLILEKELEYRFLDEEVLLSFVPKGIIKKYITDEEFKHKALELWKKKKIVKPMIYKEDRSFLRFLMLRKRLWNYYKEYKNSYWR